MEKDRLEKIFEEILEDENKDFLSIENNILLEMDKLDYLLFQYLKINKSTQLIVEGFNPILIIKKRILRKNIITELKAISDNLDLLKDMILGYKIKQFDERLEKSNNNIKEMANKLVKIAPKYQKIIGLDKEIDRNWRYLQYGLADQDYFINEYNNRCTQKVEYEILSILEELKIVSSQKDVDYSIFQSKSYPKKEQSIFKYLLSSKSLKS